MFCSFKFILRYRDTKLYAGNIRFPEICQDARSDSCKYPSKEVFSLLILYFRRFLRHMKASAFVGLTILMRWQFSDQKIRYLLLLFVSLFNPFKCEEALTRGGSGEFRVRELSKSSDVSRRKAASVAKEQRWEASTNAGNLTCCFSCVATYFQ